MYKKYSWDQIERFIRVKQEEGLLVPKADALYAVFLKILQMSQ